MSSRQEREKWLGPNGTPAADRSRRWVGWRWLIGLALLVTLVIAAGPGRLIQTMGRASPGWTLAMLCLGCVWLLLGALNVWLLLRRLCPVELPLFTRVYITSWAAALFLPGQLGDVTQVALLRRAGVPAASSAASYLLDKLVSLAWLTVVTAYGLGRYTSYHPALWLLIASLVAAAGFATVRLLLRMPPAARPWLLKGQTAVRRATAQLLLFRTRPAALATNWLVTVVKWCLTAALYLVAFRAVGGRISLEAAATIPVMSSLVGYLPVTVAGLGSMELTAVALFGALGVEAALVLGAYLLLRFVLALAAVLLLASMELSKGRLRGA